MRDVLICVSEKQASGADGNVPRYNKVKPTYWLWVPETGTNTRVSIGNKV